MKVMSLNIWGGHIENALLNFIGQQQDVDIICLQEVYHNALDKFSTDDKIPNLNIFSIIDSLLPEHQAFFKPVIGQPSGNAYGICMFVKNDFEILKEGDLLIHHNPDYPTYAPSRHGPRHSRNLQWITCSKDNSTFTIMNVHGLWNGQGKLDTSDRLSQSQAIKQFSDQIKTPKILCGDFNLRPDTLSFKMIKEGMSDLIEKYQIPTTRTPLYTKREAEPFADYILTCPNIQVNSFQVLPDVVSDHAPLVLDFVLNCERVVESSGV